MLFLVWGIIIAGAFISALHSVGKKWLLNEGIGTTTVFIIGTVVFALSSAAIVFWGGTKGLNRLKDDVSHTIKPKHWALMIAAPLLATIISYAYLWALRKERVTLLKPCLKALSLALTVMGGIFVLKEQVDRWDWVAMGFILAGFILFIYRASKKGSK